MKERIRVPIGQSPIDFFGAARPRTSSLPLRAKKITAIRRLPLSFFRGFEQIRTAVGAFAELCLTTRPRNHFGLAAKLRKFRGIWKKYALFADLGDYQKS
jgi:hypothetical protein